MAKLGTKGAPAIIKFSPNSKQDEILAAIDRHKIEFIAGFENEEDISDLKGLMPESEYAAIADPDYPSNFRTRGKPALFLSKIISRNAPCPCGSGKQYKRCCGK